MTVSSLKVYLIFLKGADASDLFLSISSVRARVTGRSERISSVIQSSWTLREAMTKKGRCSVFRQRPFDVSATTGCCGFFALVRTADFLSRISEVMGKSETSVHTRILPTKPQVAEAQNRGWSVDFGFSPHFRKRLTEVCGKFRKPRAHRPFHKKKPQVESLSLSSEAGMSSICRILLV